MESALRPKEGDSEDIVGQNKVVYLILINY